MSDPKGFLTTPRQSPTGRPVDVRIRDWRETSTSLGPAALERQAGRCMDCGVPFCHAGCPLGNLIPEWNDLVWRRDWREAAARLHATNNFPEFTGRLCPAPCESACVLGIASDPVTIKCVEAELADRAWAEGWVSPLRPAARTGRSVAVVGSGPAGLAAAQQLARAGHAVTVFERADAPGGLLRYGIPDFKMEKRHLERRLAQLRAEGVRFACGVYAGADVPAAKLRARYHALVLATGATVARSLPVPGAELAGVHQAMDYLCAANRAVATGSATQISAHGRHVVIVGGGDTGSDCVGTAHRQGAASVTQLQIHPRPPADRPPGQPWPAYPAIFRVSCSHEEGGERVFSVATQEFLGDGAGRVRALRLVEVAETAHGFTPIPGSERELACDLALLALGFTGPEPGGLLEQLGVALAAGGTVARDAAYATSARGVFAAGDAGRGQSLIVWAIAEGRSAAAAVDAYLMGSTGLPAPVRPADQPL